jgi:hypothetical protein
MASELGVGTVLQGSVRYAGGRLRVFANLIEARTQRSLWSQTLTPTGTDDFEIQRGLAREIAAAVANASGQQPARADAARSAAGPSTDSARPTVERATETARAPAAAGGQVAATRPENPASGGATPSTRQGDARPAERAARTTDPAPTPARPAPADPQPSSTGRAEPPAQPAPVTPAEPQPVPAPPPTAAPAGPTWDELMADPARLRAGVRGAIEAFANRIASGQEGRIRALFPNATEEDIARIREQRGAGEVNVSLAAFDVRRFDPAGTETNFVLVFETGSPPVRRPVPFRARLAYEDGQWRVIAFGRR